MSTIDFGLEAAICEQWQQKHLLDYTIQVEEQEIKVHKQVLISISDYFRAMLCGTMKESETDKVRLTGLKAETVSKILELVYTGQPSIITDNVTEILSCAMYLQMPLVVKVCVQTLIDGLKVQNCLKILSVCVTYSLAEETDQVKCFLKSKWKAIIAHYKQEDLSLHWLQLLVNSWAQSERDLFLYIKKWVEIDVENHKPHIDILMSQVRFPLMTPAKLEEIRAMDMFAKCEGAWCKLVHEAIEYHTLPIHMKVLNNAEQINLRSNPVPVVFLTNERLRGYMCQDSFYALKPSNTWDEHRGEKTPTFCNFTPVYIAVNNFFIVCSGLDDEQHWDIFDPRTMTWSPMSKMNTPKIEFTLINHDGKLYAIGGQIDQSYDLESLTDSVEEYSFVTGKWRTINKLPFAVSKHGACVYNGSVYISGGYRNDKGKYDSSKELNCLDLVNGTSESRAPMPKKIIYHQMQVMTLRNKEVIVVIDVTHNFKIRCYNPKNNTWAAFRPSVSSVRNLDLQWSGDAIMMGRGNIVYFINILTATKGSDDWCYTRQDCVRWEFSENETAITEVYLERFPMCTEVVVDGLDAFGAVLPLNVK